MALRVVGMAQPHMLRQYWEMGFRPQRSTRMLMNDSSVSFREMVGYNHSTWMETSDRLLDDLLSLARPRPILPMLHSVERWERF